MLHAFKGLLLSLQSYENMIKADGIGSLILIIINVRGTLEDLIFYVATSTFIYTMIYIEKLTMTKTNTRWIARYILCLLSQAAYRELRQTSELKDIHSNVKVVIHTDEI